jgi:predicted dienelactone hydrolase
MLVLRFLVPIACLLGVVTMARAADPAYDPLAIDSPAALPAPLDLDVVDEGRERTIPVRVWLPSHDRPAPVILFSHGLGGARDGNAYLGRHWSARGYCVVFLQHAGSDEAVWRDLPFPERLPALRKAINLSTTLDRYRDVPAVLDRLDAWNGEAGGPLDGRLDPARVGIAGHSFGAVTAQGVTGQRTADRRTPFTDRRIGAALLMSPSLPRIGDGQSAFGSIAIPWMIMTGTEDDSPVGNATPESRREVFAALPPGEKYELVLFQGEHQAFGDRVLPGSKRPRDPNHHRVVLALSTAFFDAFLRGDKAALGWLESDAPRSVLADGDLWQWK